MDETKLIELYQEGMDSIISSVKNMHTELTTQISVLNKEIADLNKEISRLNKDNMNLNTNVADCCRLKI